MSDAEAPFRASDASNGPEAGALTPSEIERVLADFRSWLDGLASAPVPELPAPPAETVDLSTLVGQFVALRHEVNLQTKAARAALEQNAEALRQLTEAAEDSEPAPAGPPVDDVLRPLLKAVIDVYDSLALAARQVERTRDSLAPALETVLAAAQVEPPPTLSAAAPAEPPHHPGLLARLFGAKAAEPGTAAADRAALAEWRERVIRAAQERERRVREAVERLQSAFESVLTGYTMSLRRVERMLPQFELEPLDCIGQPFEPELMEVVEVVPDGDHPPGQVVEEVRRGYRWRGRLFRYAQVRVAR